MSVKSAKSAENLSESFNIYWLENQDLFKNYYNFCFGVKVVIWNVCMVHNKLKK